MTLGLFESWEDYEEIFQLSYRRARFTLGHWSLKLVLLSGIKEYMLDTLNTLSEEDIYQLSYDDIKTMFKNHYRAIRKKGRARKDLANYSPSTTSIKNEIGNMFEDFKSEMLHTFDFRMDTMQIKRKEGESERALASFYPECTRRHPINECPLNVIKVYLVFEEKHATDTFLYFHWLKFVYQREEGGDE